MATRGARSPGSRLGDDLYRMYLIGLGWFVFPIYGGVFAQLLPTSAATMEWVYPVGAVCLCLGWLWSGARGGPMMVSRASIVHELGAPVSARTVLAPQLLRQAVGWASGGAAVGGVLTSIGDDYSYSQAFAVSGAGFLLCFAAVAWACVAMVATRHIAGLRRSYLVSTLIAAGAVSATVIASGSITETPVLVVLALAAVAGAATAWHALDSVPVHGLWERARNLESARSALMAVDFHRMMTDVRGAGDNRAAGTTRVPGRFGLSGWRCLAPLRHALPWSGLRLLASCGATVLLVSFAPLDQGVVLLALGGVWLFVGFELTRGLAALVDQVAFIVHYPRSSLPMVAGQVGASFLLGLVLIAATMGWRLGVDRTEATAAIFVAAMGVIGGAMQARLGAPDTSTLVAKYGLQTAAGLLWARAAAAPLAVVAVVILVFHAYALQPLNLDFDFDPAPLAQVGLRVLILFSLVVCLRPLQRMAR